MYLYAPAIYHYVIYKYYRYTYVILYIYIHILMGLSYFFLAVKWWVGSMEIHLMAPVWVSLCFAEQCFLMIIDISGTCIYPKYFVYNYNISSRYNEYSRVANVTCDLCSCELLSASSSTRPGVARKRRPQLPDLQRWDRATLEETQESPSWSRHGAYVHVHPMNL